MVPIQQGLIEVLATTFPVIGTPFNVPYVGAVSDMNAHTRYPATRVPVQLTVIVP